MAHVDREPLGAATVVRKYFVDINTGTEDIPVWTPVGGISNFKPPAHVPELRDDSDFDTEDGSTSQEKTGYSHTMSFTVQRKRTKASATVYDTGQEALRDAAESVGQSNQVDIRWYEVNEDTGPTSEAYRAKYGVAWAPVGGQKNDLDMVELTLHGRGAISAITHPDDEVS